MLHFVLENMDIHTSFDPVYVKHCAFSQYRLFGCFNLTLNLRQLSFLQHLFFEYLECMTAQNTLLSIKVTMEQAACQILSSAINSAMKQSDGKVQCL